MRRSLPIDARGPVQDWSLPALLRRPVEAGAFWAAIVLPFYALALLVGGVETTSDAVVLLGVLVTNLLALVVGHGHRR